MYKHSLKGHGGIEGREERHEEARVTGNEPDVHNKEGDGER